MSQGPHEMDVVSVVRDYGDSNQAEKEIVEELKKHPDIRYIFGLNGRSAIGATQALRRSRKANGGAYSPGEVIVTGWDSDDDLLAEITAGWIQSTSVLNSSLCTQISFSILEALNLGYLYPENLQLQEFSFPAVPQQILIDETLVHKDNVHAYRRKK